MNRAIEKYIKENSISTDHTYIFRDWEDFLHLLYENNERVEMIVWYEYCEISNQQLGMGGYIDTQNKGYMWAETQIFECDLQEKSLGELLTYISETRKQYSDYELYPEFYVKEILV